VRCQVSFSCKDRSVCWVLQLQSAMLVRGLLPRYTWSCCCSPHPWLYNIHSPTLNISTPVLFWSPMCALIVLFIVLYEILPFRFEHDLLCKALSSESYLLYHHTDDLMLMLCVATILYSNWIRLNLSYCYTLCLYCIHFITSSEYNIRILCICNLKWSLY